jgi:hypothetical protein
MLLILVVAVPVVAFLTLSCISCSFFLLPVGFHMLGLVGPDFAELLSYQLHAWMVSIFTRQHNKGITFDGDMYRLVCSLERIQSK